MANDPKNITDVDPDVESVIEPDDDTLVDPDLEPYDESVEKPLKDSENFIRQKSFSEVMLLINFNLNWR
ncbi:MAG TPA: hypothetical protein VK958_10600 [Methylophilus sp.]|uniref:hypothetical protein n=1 Tax=Methylophilus sp. TaxID=29541 RepID=UPI002C401A76|nr:hypothetical protein [Methylophilus sp.]HSH87683.1 hypothetical protein [Methylophilus sp.]